MLSGMRAHANCLPALPPPGVKEFTATANSLLPLQHAVSIAGRTRGAAALLGPVSRVLTVLHGPAPPQDLLCVPGHQRGRDSQACRGGRLPSQLHPGGQVHHRPHKRGGLSWPNRGSSGSHHPGAARPGQRGFDAGGCVCESNTGARVSRLLRHCMRALTCS